jgi:ABC-type glycerol-3-phosphate transport system permease component
MNPRLGRLARQRPGSPHSRRSASSLALDALGVFDAARCSTSLPTPILPPSLTLQNYRTLFGGIGMGRYVLNSLLIATAATAISVSFNLMAGYAFAKLRFRGRDAIFRLLLGALVIPGQVAMLPLFLMLKPMGLINTYGGAIVPPWRASSASSSYASSRAASPTSCSRWRESTAPASCASSRQ